MFCDLHCDLLSYLALGPYKSAFDDECRASIGQHLDGGCLVQTCAISTATKKGSAAFGMKQAKIYNALSEKYEGYFAPAVSQKKAKIKTLLAVENASSFFEEKEPLAKGIKRFEWLNSHVEKPLYLGLTWHYENRFGGGNQTNVGLKKEGKELLEALAGSVHAIDLSHTSDALAYDLIDEIDRKKLPYKIIASHSNFRKVVPGQKRNLPDDLALEIKKRDGLMGLNGIHDFVGKSINDFLLHVEHGLSLGLEDNLALGFDFFFEKKGVWRNSGHVLFFEGFENSSCYKRLEKLLLSRFPKKIVEKIASKNFLRFTGI